MKLVRSKLLSILLCLTLLAGLVPLAALPALADGEIQEIDLQIPEDSSPGAWTQIKNDSTQWSGLMEVPWFDDEIVTIGSETTGQTVTITGDTTLKLSGDLVVYGPVVNAGAGAVSLVVEGPGRLYIHGGIDGVTLTVDKTADVLVYGSEGQAAIAGNVVLSGGRLIATGGIQGHVRLAGGTLMVNSEGGGSGSMWMANGYGYKEPTEPEMWEGYDYDTYRPTEPVATVTGAAEPFYSLHDAVFFAATGSTAPNIKVTLLADVETASTINIERRAFEFDLNGHGISFIGSDGPVIRLSMESLS